MNWDADVYQDEVLVAHMLGQKNGVVLRFTGARPDQPGFLATTIPYAKDDVEYTSFPSFLMNLLPEGARLALLLGSSRDAKDDFLSQLLKVGRDTVGDVAVVRHGQTLVDKAKPAAEEVKSFWDSFHAAYTPGSYDKAIPGVQEKLSDETISLPVQTKAWPGAILKLTPKAYPRLVQNEHFFMAMARDCGLETATTRLMQDQEGEWGLLVRRFDRDKAGRGKLRKFHQEDGCQLLDEPPGRKDKVSFRGLLERIRELATSPPAETLRVVQLYAYCYLIGNADLHGKNISLYWRDGVSKLTPCYDLLSTLPYPALTRNMALKLDGKDDSFRRRDLVSFAARYGVPDRATEVALDRMVGKVPRWTARLGEMGYDEGVTDRLRKEIETRAESLSQ